MKKRLIKIVAILLVALCAMQTAGCMCVPVAALSAIAAAEAVAHKDDLDAVLITESGNDVVLPMPSGNVPETEEEEVLFSDIKYEKPDTAKISDAIRQLDAVIDAGESAPDSVLDQYDAVLEMYNHLDSEESLAYVLYAMDVTEDYYSDEYDFLVEELNRIDLELTDVSIKLFESDKYAEPMLDRYGPVFKENVYLGEKLNSPEIQEDLSAEQKLVSEYDTLLTTFAAEDGGKTYTMDDIIGIASTDYKEYVRLFTQYYSQLNQKAGAIYLKLLKIRNTIAKKLHYDTFADYRYEGYGRDYTREDIQELQKAVKEHLVPLYKSAVIRQYLTSPDTEKGLDNIPLSTFMNRFEGVLGDFSEKIQSSFRYMLRNGLITTDVSEKKMETSFTTFLSDYHSPFIFTQYEGKIRSAKTIIHESGHYANFYYMQNYGWNISDPLDIAEIDSQALELLMTHYYDRLFGNMAATERTDQLIDGLYAILSGCMEDEFQQRVYENPDMTLEEMNRMYYELADEYGFAELYGYTGTEWAAIPHSFQSPMYYISYAVSMIAAMEIWELSEKDFDAARDVYLTILCRPANSKFRTLTTENGLKDPVSPATVKSLAKSVSKALNGD
ncbi:MAG: M2 family metallopeptidase [Clostridia bacterium]|nr:M2 family metallopeptidase [Clostridia bacterium]